MTHILVVDPGLVFMLQVCVDLRLS